MKTLMILLFSVLFSLSTSAQQETTFSRKGRILVETGYNILGGLGIGGGTGSSIIFGEGSSVTTLGFDGGYFISDDFAIKAGLGIILADGTTLTNFSAGGKYYIIGKVPVELGLGFLSFGNGFGSSFLGDARIGYGISVADNINLEPYLGLIFGDGTIGQFGVSFALFL